MAYAPLAGVKVLDMSRLLPGPYCTLLLADLGADVVKIEEPGQGDYARSVLADFGGPPLFEAANRNKRSVAINYRHPAGRDLILRLAGSADIFLETFRPGAVTRWGLGYDALSAANPRIIYASLSGYGQTGPYASRAGHDLNYLALGGWLGLNGPADGAPVPPGVQVADLAGGMLAALSILAALWGRGQDGRGRYLDVAMLDAVVSWVGPLAGSPRWPWLRGCATTRGQMPLAGALPCYNVYACSDGAYLAVSALEPHFWTTFCATVGRDDLLERRLDRSAVSSVAALLGTRSRPEWLALFATVDACVEPVNDVEEMVAHPQVRHRGLVDEGGLVTSPLRFAAQAAGSCRAPGLGEHTVEVLLASGLSEEQIADLTRSGAVALPA